MPDNFRHMPEMGSWAWDCWTCRKPWPCEAAKAEAAATLSVTPLTLYMAAWMTEAARMMPKVSGEELHERFIAWIRTHPGLYPDSLRLAAPDPGVQEKP